MTVPVTSALDAATVEQNFGAIRDAIELAAGMHPDLVNESHYRIAGRAVSVRIVGNRLHAQLTRAIAHLAVSEVHAAPALRIEMWDEHETGVSTPLCVPVGEEGSARSTMASDDGRFVLFRHARTRSVLDRVERRIVGWVVGAEQLSQYELGRPWHSELLMWQRDLGLQPLHAGFISRNGEGLLLGGPGGSGKSTTSLSCMQDGWAYLADDYVSVERTSEGIMGYGAYNSAHLDPTHLQRFPRLMPDAIPGRLAREDKSLVLASNLSGVTLAAQSRICMVAFPRIVDQPVSSFRVASKAEALLRLAPSSLLLLPYVQFGHAAFRNMSELVMELPTFWLDVGRDIAQLPKAVDAMYREALA